MKLSIALSTFFTSIAIAAPAVTLDKRAETFCGQWDLKNSGNYILYNNLWGKADATSGSQCTTFNSNSGNTISWSTAWTWAGGAGHVKSYANVVLVTTAKTVAAIKSIPMTWKWSIKGNNMVANVSSDIFTSSTPTGKEEYEIMIWMGSFGGAGPISATGKPIATVNLAGATWNLWNGRNGNMNVYSFVATTQQSNFSGDVKLFFNYLVKSHKFPTNQYVKSIGSGTEPFSGSNVVLSTSAYKVSVA